ncbi:MAG: polyprenyl synthetase family protein [Anaerolineae bacterium]|nr:polyprenyl synthetase family protein [Anaerolineae bacterium]
MGISGTLLYTNLLRQELEDVTALMGRSNGHLPPYVSETIYSIINSSGKRLRPALLLLSARMFQASVEQALPLAAAIELLHTATLIHDDLVDNATQRRNIQTLNSQWPSGATVLAGDLVFSWAAKMATQGENSTFLQRFSETLETICAGELDQMFQGRGNIPSREGYYKRIFGKTASLFMLATEIGPVLSRSSETDVQNMANYGKWVGQAFQITDDVLDFMSTPEELGKPIGSDLRQGLVTLPMLYYLESNPDDTRVEKVLYNPQDEVTLQTLVNAVRQSEAPEQAMAEAQTLVSQALDVLENYPATPYRRGMEEIARFAVQRRY